MKIALLYRSRAADRIDWASQSLLEQLSDHNDNLHHQGAGQYDVFLSYAHKNLDQARQVLTGLQALEPQPRIFFDYDTLKTGLCFVSDMGWSSRKYLSLTFDLSHQSEQCDCLRI